MPLQNRCDPYKQIRAVSARGQWMGNRGRLHDTNRKVKWFQMTQRWIICELEFKNRKREVMAPNSYTELFFMDEATALAAGHRPCMECRRPDAKQFLNLSGFKKVDELDAQLHSERMLNGPAITQTHDWPDGTMIGWNFRPYLVWQGKIYRWSYEGYTPVESIESDLNSIGENISDFPIELLTPLTTVEVLRRGYTPQVNL